MTAAGEPRPATREPDAVEGGLPQGGETPSDIGPAPAPRVRDIVLFWAPLALMWLLMSTEQPILAAVIARLPEAERNLAAFGLSFSLALIVEAPVIMMLTAGTALATGPRAYRNLLRYTHVMALSLGLLHLAIAITPAYGWFVRSLVGAPESLVAPGRLAFLAMTPWTPAIAYRRMWQGVLIRYGFPGRVSMTTMLRIPAVAAVCGLGLYSGANGALTGGAAMSVGVLVGGCVAYGLVRSTVRDHLSGPDEEIVRGGARSARDFLAFYGPLAATSLLVLGAQPAISFALGRAPDALRALAIWPVLMGLGFVLRSGGFAYQEVAVAQLERPTAAPAVRRAAWGLGTLLSALMAVVAFTPVGTFYLATVTGLEPVLVEAAMRPLALMVPIPLLSTLVSWLRGVHVAAGCTGQVTRAVGVDLVVLFLVLAFGLTLGRGLLDGASLGALAMDLALAAETLWLAVAARRGREGKP